MSNTTNTPVVQSPLTVNIASFADIVERTKDASKLKAHEIAILKLKKQKQLANSLGSAEIAMIEAQDAFEKSLLSEGVDPVAAVQSLEKAEKTFKYYQAVYNALFPNA